MRTAFLASLPLLVSACAALQNPVELPLGGSIHYSSRSSQTRLEIRTKEGKRYALGVKRDATVSPKAAPTSVKIIGEVKDAAIILVDTYPSIPGGMSYCQAGEERFLRVISIAKTPARETLQLKLASCRQNIELAEPGMEWNPESSTLRINWLLGPSMKEKPEARTIRIGANGIPE